MQRRSYGVEGPRHTWYVAAMFKFRAKSSRPADSSTALVERPLSSLESLDEPGLHDELHRLAEQNRQGRRQEIEQRILEVRNAIGVRRLEGHAVAPAHPAPESGRLPTGPGLPEFTRGELTPGLLRAGILRDGCVLVRGLIPREDALRLAEQIDRSFQERERHDTGERHDGGLYSEFMPDDRYGQEMARPWIKMGGGVLAVDSPRLSFEMGELFAAAGLPGLVEGYLGEPPLITAQKTTLRKADPSVAGSWHQDGKFMGKVRALNLWLSLSRCGDEAPGLDIVPRRLEEFVTTQTDGELLDYTASQQRVEDAAGEARIVRPIFEPGDALFFDDLFMHKTGSDPSMPKPRYAIENWFFGGSAFPTEYAPLAV